MADITLKDFDEKYMQPRNDWDFEKFAIRCKKCDSEKTEVGGKTEVENGYYGEISFEGKLIVKCHDCGSAFSLKLSGSGSSEWCSNCEGY